MSPWSRGFAATPQIHTDSITNGFTMPPGTPRHAALAGPYSRPNSSARLSEALLVSRTLTHDGASELAGITDTNRGDLASGR